MYEKIQAGYYNTTLAYGRVEKPAALSKRAGDLNEYEANNLAQIKADYARALEDAKAMRKAYDADVARLRAEFDADLIAEMGWNPELNLTKALITEAWEQGHSSGYAEVYNMALNLDSIYRAAIKDINRS